MIPFEEMIDDNALKFTAEKLRVLQVNIGSLCNLSCTHCHINAGPGRKGDNDSHSADTPEF